MKVETDEGTTSIVSMVGIYTTMTWLIILIEILVIQCQFYFQLLELDDNYVKYFSY